MRLYYTIRWGFHSLKFTSLSLEYCDQSWNFTDFANVMPLLQMLTQVRQSGKNSDELAEC